MNSMGFHIPSKILYQILDSSKTAMRAVTLDLRLMPKLFNFFGTSNLFHSVLGRGY